MPYNPEMHHRRSIRLKEFDYTQPGAYFITIVAQNREWLFGDIVDDEMRLNPLGRVVEKEWERLSQRFENLKLDEFMVMPNHVHGIIVIADRDNSMYGDKDGIEHFGKPIKGSIPTIVRSFKSATTLRINLMRQSKGLQVWQRNYFEHVIRNESEWGEIREYIRQNPDNWEVDLENPKGL